ncbi:MAG: ABC transporter substrate-binding protein, partial [Candidatus Lustribacter sp.]
MKRRNALGMIGAGLTAAAAPAAAGAATSLRIATLPIDGTALAYYAQDLKYFQDAGLDVTIQG